MKAKILLLIILNSLILCCRTKNKITNSFKENQQDTEKVKIDSVSLQNSKTIQNRSVDTLLDERKSEISGEILITGKSDLSNPFVFHSVSGNDTIQSISIMGNAEYSISNHYVKADHKKSEGVKEKLTNTFQDTVQHGVSKEISREKTSAVSEETKKIKANGFQAGTWIVITIVMTFLLFIFFTYKYFKK